MTETSGNYQCGGWVTGEGELQRNGGGGALHRTKLSF